MANLLNKEKQEALRDLFQESGNIRGVAKALGLSRNTVRRFLRSEGLSSPALQLPITKPTLPEKAPESAPHSLEKLDFMLLEKLFKETGEPGAERDFGRHIKGMAHEIAQELGIRGRLDTLKLEAAVFSYIVWRRFYLKSLDASDVNYCGPFMKNHEKLARVTESWIASSNKAFDQMTKVLRELEIKYNKRLPNFGSNNVFVQNQQLNVSGSIENNAARQKFSTPQISD